MMDINEINKVLDTYESKIQDSKHFLTYNRNPFSTWTLFKITILASIMTPSDFFLLMIKHGFIDPSNVRCKLCKGPMKLNRAERPDGYQWDCKQQKVHPTKPWIKIKACDISKTARSNSWFFNSKLSLPEVLIITHHWWYKVRQLVIFYFTTTPYITFRFRVALHTLKGNTVSPTGRCVIGLVIVEKLLSM